MENNLEDMHLDHLHGIQLQRCDMWIQFRRLALSQMDGWWWAVIVQELHEKCSKLKQTPKWQIRARDDNFCNLKGHTKLRVFGTSRLQEIHANTDELVVSREAQRLSVKRIDGTNQKGEACLEASYRAGMGDQLSKHDRLTGHSTLNLNLGCPYNIM